MAIGHSLLSRSTKTSGSLPDESSPFARLISTGTRGRCGFHKVLPLLGVMVMLGELRSAEQSTTSTPLYDLARGLGMLAAMTGVVAAFWHIYWIAGVSVIVAGVFGICIYGTHFAKTAVRRQQR